MKKRFEKFMYNTGGSGSAIVIITFIITFLFCYALSWILTCGIIKLITLCFGWIFSWKIATGIWLILCIASRIFSNTTTIKK